MQQRAEGVRDLRDTEIPDIEHFSKIASGILVAYDTVFIFSSIFLIAGVSAEKRFLLVPWLVNLMLTILLVVVLFLAIIFSDQFKFSIDGQFNPNAILSITLVVLPLLLSVYLWFVVYTTFLQLQDKNSHKFNNKIKGHTIERRKSGPWQPLVSSSSDNNAGDQTTTTTSFGKIDELDTGNNSPCGDGNEGISTGRTNSTLTMCDQGHPQHRSSLSNSSFSSIKESLQVVIGGTPPPPYEAVASDIDKEEKAIKAGIQRSELFFAAVSAADEIKASNDLNFTDLKEGKVVDDNYLAVANRKKQASKDTQDASSRRLLGKSLEDITSTEKKAAKSASYCQLPSTNIAVTCSPRAVQHSTVARLHERPSLDISDLGFGSALKPKDNNNYEVAC